MTTDIAGSDARQRVMDTAETLFMQRGYSAITLRDIAEELGIRQASLYYHFPEGKEQIYVAVVERAFERHRVGMEAAIDTAGPALAGQLRAIAQWFETQPRMNLSSIMHADIAALNDANARHLGQVAYACLFEPLRQAFIASNQRGDIRPVNPNVLAGTFLSVIDGLAFSTHRKGAPIRAEMVDEVISVLLDGLRSSPGHRNHECIGNSK